jgi:SPP1 gp7 family putative phage head morphogenesis protein
MTEGLAAGESPRTITNKIVAQVGGKAIRGRIQTITRTETLRAYRGSLRDSMESFGSDVVTGWRWVSALSRRSCPACLAMHGTEYGFDQYPDRFHVACRCSVQPIVSTEILPRRSPGKTGEEWLREQPAAVQRRILQTKERYEAFRTGTPLGDFLEVKSDETWGDSIAVKPMGRTR